jgi:hypothetical protein
MTGVTSTLFESFARNGEDVVLWRALGGVAPGVVLELIDELSDQAPGEFSATRALAERGWTVLRLSGAELTGAGSGVSELAGQQLHAVVSASPELAEPGLAALTEVGQRPWTVVISTAELAVPEAVAGLEEFGASSGYELCLFDGVSGYFVHPEHAAELRTALSYPASSRDLFSSPAIRQLEEQRAALAGELAEAAKTIIQWRAAALQRWDAATGGGQPSQAYRELEAMRNTVSWRVTRPLRAVRRRVPLPGSGG